MIVQLKNSLGVYRPLDLFEDFEIKYNHQYEDYKSVGGKKIPYTNKFKIPLTENNRNLTTIEFDAVYPKKHSIEGRVMHTDGTLAFNMIADIERQTINVLEPYIEISVIDIISKALSDMAKFKMSDLLEGNTFNLVNDRWVFGDQSDLTDIEKFYLFPYFNFNNKNAIFGFDAKRNLSQLQPTFIINKLMDKMFNYIGVNYESKFLSLDNQLKNGVLADDLGLMLPCTLKTKDSYAFTVDQRFSGTAGASSFGSSDRLAGVPSAIPTTSRLVTSDFTTYGSRYKPLKFNYDWRSDSVYNGISMPNPYGAKMCSLVDGVMNLRLESYDRAIKPIVQLGRVYSSTAAGLNNWMHTTSVVGTPVDLDIRMVDAEMEEKLTAAWWTYNYYTESTAYDIKTSKSVGTAVFKQVNPTTGTMDYELVFYDSVDIEFDVKANKDLGLAFVLAPKAGTDMVTQAYTATDSYDGGTYEFEMRIQEGFMEYAMISSTDHTDDYYDKQAVMYSRPTGIDMSPTKLTFDFTEATEIPSGFSTADEFDPAKRDLAWVNNVNVDMGESMKSVKDYTLLEVLKMIMERFNLQLYMKSDGLVHVDSFENRLSGVNFPIDHLIDEGIDVEFTASENGILSISDDSANFYDEDFNRLEKVEISETKRDEVSLNFKSSIVNKRMFDDVYDDSGYDLLKYNNDTNYWGTADREQVVPKDLKPTFCMLKSGETPVFFPYNNCSYSTYIPDAVDENGDPAVQIDFGFYHTFYNFEGIHPTLKLEAVNIHPINGFKFISFKNNEIEAGANTLYKQTWFQWVQDKLNDESVIISLDIYADELTMSTLMDFPTIQWKGQDWEFLGFNNYPLSAQDGGMVSVTMVKKKDWSTNDIIPIIPKVTNVTMTTIIEPYSHTLNWSAVVIDDFSHYEVWVSYDNGDFFLLDTTSNIHYTHGDLIVIDSHRYKIRAVDLNGYTSSEFSNIVGDI